MSKSKEMYQDLMNGEIHKSILQSFVRCPALIRFLGIKVNSPDEIYISEDEWGTYLKNKGSFFHEFAKYFSMLTNDEELLSKIRNMYKQKLLIPEEVGEIKDMFIAYTIPEEELKDEDSAFVHYYHMIDSYLGFEAKRLVDLRKMKMDKILQFWKPVAVEIEFDVQKIVTFPDKIVNEFSVKDLLLKAKGTIDRINRFDIEKKTLEIMEYKTGGWNNQSSSKMTSVRRELAFYALFNSPMTVDGKEWETTQMSCYNPEVPPAINYMTSPIKSVTTNAMLKQLLRLTLALEDDDFDQPVCSPYICSYCEYLDTCGSYYKEQWDATNGNFQETKDKRHIERKKNVAPY